MDRSPQHPLERAVSKTIQEHRLLNSRSMVLVGVSGGPDSVALLLLLKKLYPDNISGAAYVDHNLRPQEAVQEKQYVQSLCRSLAVEFVSASVDVPQEIEITGDSPEACARRLRYRALETIRADKAATATAVGHTRDDQVEEILIRLIRGTGARGLSGMRYVNGTIIRPLLDSAKQDLQQYLAEKNVSYCLDQSNRSPVFLRNRVRHTLLPVLERQFNPSVKKNILNTAAILRDEDDYLQAGAMQLYGSIFTGNIQTSGAESSELTCRIEDCKATHPALARRMLEEAFWRSGSRPTFSSIENVWRLARSGRTGQELHHADGLIVYRTATEIIFSRTEGANNTRERSEPLFEEVIITEVGQYPLPSLNKNIVISRESHCCSRHDSELLVDADRVPLPLIVRAPRRGERFVPLGAPGGKTVSRFLSDRKIPKHQRHAYPVLSAADKIIGVLGLTIAESVKITPETRSCFRIRYRD